MLGQVALDLYHNSIMNTFLQVKTSDIKNQQKKPKKQKHPPQKKTKKKKLKRCLIEKYRDDIDQCLVF